MPRQKKLIFTQGVKNHAKYVAEYADALVYIGNLLPRAQLSVELYQNHYVKGAVARLYEQILLFFRPAIKWYSSTIRRLATAVYSPFESGLKDTVANIRGCAMIVDEAARSCMQIEQRQTSNMIFSQLPDLGSWRSDISAEMGEMRDDVRGLFLLFVQPSSESKDC